MNDREYERYGSLHPDAAVAETYASRVLETGPAISRILRERINFSLGVFRVTAPFVVDREGHWGDTLAAPGDEVPTPSGSSLRGPLPDAVLERLGDGRVLVLGSAYVEGRTPPDAAGASPMRVVQQPVEGGFETHFLVPGPQSRPDDLLPVLNAAVGMHHAVGAIARCATSEIPPHGALVDEGVLEHLLADVKMTFMRMTSYDGFLIWEPAAQEP